MFRARKITLSRIDSPGSRRNTDATTREVHGLNRESEQLFAHIANLAPAIEARAAEIDKPPRRIPHDLVDLLTSIGLFRMFVPESHGGLQLEMPTAVKVIEALAAIDGSIGWTAMVNSGAALFAPRLPLETFERMYQDGPNVVLAGSAVLGGTAARDSAGWRVTGRWPFAMGSQLAEWILGVCIMTDAGSPILRADLKTPIVRAFFLPADEWTIEDT